ncbi:MAG: hypothetical protein ACYCQL_00260 [Acidithiobacillus sp.]
MQPCNECHACSFPDRVAQAKSTLPAQWVAELVEEEATDHIWIAALNLYGDFVDAGQPAPQSILQVWDGGQIHDNDRAWAKRQLAGMGIPAVF